MQMSDDPSRKHPDDPGADPASPDRDPGSPEGEPGRPAADQGEQGGGAPDAGESDAAERAAGPRKEARALSPWSLLLGGAVLAAVVLGQWTWLIPILGLALLITVHEFGHFIAAKSFGMRVEKFYVGFPPAALRRTWGETEYGIGIIPLGGFCKISGMTPEEPVNDGVAATIVSDAGDGRLERTYTVAEADEGLKELEARVRGAHIDGKTAADPEVVRLHDAKRVLEAYRAERLAPEGPGDPVYYKQAVWKRNVTIAAGPLMNFLAAAVIMILFVGISGVPKATLTLDEVVKGTPASAAGLVAGDTLVGADGATWTTWDEASAYFRAHPHETISLTYEPKAGGPERTVEVRLVSNPQVAQSGYLGVRAGVTRDRPGPVEAVKLGATGFRDVVVGTFTGFWWLFSGRVSATGPDGAAGPVGIINVSHQAVEQDWYPVLLAFLSFNLGLINLLPILPFDGGHIAMNLVERVRGRRIDSRVFERMVAFGTVLLVLLFIFLTFNDVKRLFGG
jgi:regulator of sigma E protease